MLAIVADRWDPDRGGRERYAADLIAHLHARGTRGGSACRQIGSRVTTGSGFLRSRLRLAPRTTSCTVDCWRAPSRANESRCNRSCAARSSVPRSRSIGDANACSMTRAPAARWTARADGILRSQRARAGRPWHRAIANRRLATGRRSSAISSGTRPMAARDSGGSLRLTFVGHNFALKGLHGAIQTVERLRRGGVDASLTVAGRGPVRAFHRMADRAGVAEHVRFVGGISQDDVAGLHRASDALIHPTFYDPFPRVVIEALASGCPVITTACCGAAEILTHGRAGLHRERSARYRPPGGRGQPARASRSAACFRRAAAELGASFDQSAHFREMSRWIFGEQDA